MLKDEHTARTQRSVPRHSPQTTTEGSCFEANHKGRHDGRRTDSAGRAHAERLQRRQRGGSGDADDNTLTVWAWDPTFNIYAMQEAEKIYQKDHPDFKLDIVETPWDDLQTKLTTLAQSQETDELPDIFLMQNNAFQKNVINYPDLFSDFTDSGVDFSEFPKAVADYSTVDGVNYGLPFDAGTAIGATAPTCSRRPATRSTTSPTSPGASSSPRARTFSRRPASRCSPARPARPT